MKRYNIYRYALVLIMAMSTMVGVAQNRDAYIELNESQQFNAINYKPTQNTKLVMKYAWNSKEHTGHYLFGSKKQGHDFYVAVNGSSGLCGAYFGGASTQITISPEDRTSTGIFTVTLSKDGFFIDKGNAKSRHDYSAKYDADFSGFTEGAPIALGSCGKGDGYVESSNAYINLYEAWIYEGERLVHHYLPSKKDGYSSMYDVLTKEHAWSCVLNNDNRLSADKTKYLNEKHGCDHRYTHNEGSGKDLKFVCDVCGNTTKVSNAKNTDNELTVNDPNLDVMDKTPGTQSMVVTAMNKMTNLVVLDSITQEILHQQEYYAEPTATATVSFKPHDNSRTLMVLANTMFMEGQDSIYGWSKQYVQYLPLHEITQFEVRELQNIDQKTGIRRPANFIRFAIDNVKVRKIKGADDKEQLVFGKPEEQDVLADDMFVLERSYDKNFTDPQQVSTFTYGDMFSADTVKVGDRDVIRGWFRCYDMDQEALCNTTEMKDSMVFIGDEELLKNPQLTAAEKGILKEYFSYPERHVYYRVYRTFVHNMWNDRGNYEKERVTNSACLLPGVTTVSVEKQNSWNQDKKVKLKVRLDNPYPWEFNALLDSAKVHKVFDESGEKYGRRYIWDRNAKITIHRYSPDNEHKAGQDFASKTIVIDGKNVQWVDSLGAYIATVEDVQNLPYLHYYYSAIVDKTTTDFPVAYNETKLTTREEADACYSENSQLISSLKVSKGDVRGTVQLEWEQGDYQLESLVIKRREYGKSDSQWKEIFSTKETVTTYQDNSALIGSVYEYQVVGRMPITYRDNFVCENTLEDWGYVPYYGKLSGRVMMNNGTSMAGVKLRISRETPIYIDDVFDRYGNIMMAGVHEGVDAHARPFKVESATEPIIKKDFVYCDTVVTDAKGEWECDSLLFSSDGSRYVVEVLEYPGNFEYMGVVQAAQITLSKSQYENTDVNLVYTSTKRISGYAYYRNSTIPVPSAYFYLDGNMLYNSNGEPIRTQPDGKYTLTVSSQKPIGKLEIRKDGHKFSDDGVVIAGEVVEKDKDGYIMYDDTKVRLAGRIVGGHVQADKPLGFGLSKNNLGDDIKLVLQLEGDNSASIVYFPSDPNRSEVSETFSHENYRVVNGVRDTTEVGKTQMTSERKRIVIDVDNKTGEFMADLYPAKYKVVQMYCKGYSTLYRANEGLAVIDLSEVRPGIDKENIHMATVRDVQWMNWYDATFNRTFHNQVKVTYEQYDKGRAVKYFGDTDIKMNDPLKGEVDGKLVMLKNVGTAEAPRDSVVYTFKHPVFTSGKRYVLQVTTHEDYMYNNEQGQKIDIVPVPGDTLIVRNGIGSANDEIIAVNNENGQAMVALTANNPTFFDVGDAGLRSTHFMVKSNGFYYEGEPLKGFVLGQRKLGMDVVAMGAENEVTESGSVILGKLPSVVDVLRDPPGTNSYTYREAGTTYSWLYDSTKKHEEHFKFNTTWGVAFKNGFGLGYVTSFENQLDLVGIAVTKTTNLTMTHQKQEYTMKLNERITTSSDYRDVGAMADVYIGKEDTWGAEQYQVVDVISQSMYSQMKEGIDNGSIDVLGQGFDANGEPYYMVLHESVLIGRLGMASFAYSQKHIVNTIIPDLQQKIDNLVVNVGSQSEADALCANNTNKAVYWRLPGSQTISWNGKGGKVNVCESMRQTIEKWKTIIADNEKVKRDIIETQKNPYKRYSVADAKVEFSESAESQSIAMEWDLPTPSATFEYSAGYSNKPKLDSGPRDSFFPSRGDNGGAAQQENAVNPIVDPQQGQDQGNNNNNNSFSFSEDGDNSFSFSEDGDASFGFAKYSGVRRKENKLAGLGVAFNIGLGGGGSTSSSTTRDYCNINGGGYGFEMGTNDNGYLNVAIHHVAPRQSYYVNADAAVNKDFSDKVNSDIHSEKLDVTDAQKIHNFVFITEGGAARNPWVAPDYTLFYQDHMPLGAQLLKIDNPKIYVDKPVVNNITKDENAVFSIRMTNETEIQNGDHSAMNVSNFHLKVHDESNPYGARIFMDGQPISGGRDFIIAPGQSITKTIEVERGTNEYNYDNLKLVLSDNQYSLNDTAKISVHYLPTSTPLRLSVPTDKWVMNTFSQTDNDGKYYIPVEISDYSLTYDNFDHIDLQYKKATEGESQWVTLCSYYADSELYEKASGKKQMIESGSKINNIQFYGGVNIEEQEYNLRAVSYCRMGNDFVTRASDVISGIKDTRRPEIFGVPTPTNGILSYDEVIQFPFTERIAYNHLNATSNFTVQGYTNEMMGTFANPLQFIGSDVKVVSEVARSLTNRDFTIDLLVKMAEGRKSSPLFSVGNSMEFASLWAYDDTEEGAEGEKTVRLRLYTKDKNYVSQVIKADLKATMVRVGVIVDNATKKVRFICDKNRYECDEELMKNCGETDATYVGNKAYGPVYLGVDPSYDMARHSGEMTEVRLWSKALNTIEINQTYNKRVHGYSRDLIGYWPLNEAVGDKAYDKVNGATLNLHGTSWLNDAGFSLHADRKEVRLKADAIAGAMNEDYSLRFWFRTQSFAEKAEKACIFRSGNDELAKGNGRMYLGFENGQLVLNSMDVSQAIGTQNNFADGSWHNFTLTVSRMRNNYAVYLDGDLVLQGGADAMDHPDNGYIALGDTALSCHFDEFAVWNKALPDYYIREFYNTRFHGTESDMLIYLPFERQTVDSHNLPIREFSPCNEKLRERIIQYPDGKTEKTGEMVADGTRLVLDDDSVEQMASALGDEKNCAPLKTTPELSNLDFSWSCTGTVLQININKNDADINKQNIFVTIRDVEDEQGNTMKSPHMWTYFVDKNVLRWDAQTLNLTVPYGEKLEKQVVWRNISGRSMNYSIENTASWLSLSNDYRQTSPATTLQGIANAEQENEVTLHIGDGVSPGYYSETLYLTDDNGLSQPLVVNLTVEAQKPLWTVDPSKYEYNMNMKAIVKIKGRDKALVLDNDARDIVGAFVGTECVGVANITVKDDNSYVYMTIYGTKEMQAARSKVRFRLWDATNGIITELTRATYKNGSSSPVNEVLQFSNGTFVGVAPSRPDELTENGYTEQQISVQPGWNWIAFNVMPVPTSSTDSLFTHFSGFCDGDVIKRIDYSTYSEGTYNWYGRLCSLDYAHTYQVFAQKGGRLGIRGKEPDDFLKDVSVLANQWFDLPYHLKVVQPLSVALADFPIGDKAQIGDIIKGYNRFAVATENGWEGSLDYMRPGEGYYIYHTGEKTSFRYPENANEYTQTTVQAKRKLSAAINPANLGETSMPVIAVLDDEVGIEEGDILQAYCNGELISEADVLYAGADRQKRFFLSVNATDGNIIEFAVKRGEQEMKAVTKVRYNGNVVIGSVNQPCVIRFTETAGTGSVIGDIYDLSGRKLNESNMMRHGIYIIDGEKRVK